MDKEFTNEISVHQEEGYIAIFKHPAYKQGMNRLWDATGADAVRVSPSDINSFLSYVQATHFVQDTSNSAILVNSDYMYGMARMLQIMGDGTQTPNLLVTKDPEEALEWVTKRPKQ